MADYPWCCFEGYRLRLDMDADSFRAFVSNSLNGNSPSQETTMPTAAEALA